MKYFKNAEVSKLYNVSEKTVRNWLEATKDGKLELETLASSGKIYLANTLSNTFMLADLAEKSRKYRNSLAHRTIMPTQEFYETFTHEQIIEIATCLETYREFPLHYRYCGRGGIYWDAYLHKLYGAKKDNILSTSIELLRLETPYLESILANYRYLNIVDIGVGNGLAAKEFLQWAKETGKLKKYFGIDSSSELLRITGSNVWSWVSDVSTEMHLKDINYERFLAEISNDSYAVDASETINLFLFLGGTIGNFRDPNQALYTVRDSMRQQDLLITSDKLDSSTARRFFDFSPSLEKSELAPHNRFVVEVLGIDQDLYEVEQFFDEADKVRIIRIRLRVALSIIVKTHDYLKTVEFEKGDSILLFRATHWTTKQINDIYEENGFSQLRITKSQNEEYALLTSRVKAISS